MNNKCLCKNYDEWRGICTLSRPYCCDPFSEESCLAFQKMVASHYDYGKPEDEKSSYEPSEQTGFKPKTREEVFKHLGIRKGMVIAEWFIPDSKIEMSNADLDSIFQYGRDMVAKKFKEGGYSLHSLYTVREYIMPITQETGTLFIGLA